MKKTLIAFAALSAIAGMAQAQSTVTIYGLVDANLSSLKTNVVVGTGAAASVQSLRQTRIEGGGLNGNRWGIRVSEDLGGGMAAIANLESGFNIDTGASGQGGLLFGRRAEEKQQFRQPRRRRAGLGVLAVQFEQRFHGQGRQPHRHKTADPPCRNLWYDAIPAHQFLQKIRGPSIN